MSDDDTLGADGMSHLGKCVVPKRPRRCRHAPGFIGGMDMADLKRHTETLAQRSDERLIVIRGLCAQVMVHVYRRRNDRRPVALGGSIAEHGRGQQQRDGIRPAAHPNHRLRSSLDSAASAQPAVDLGHQWMPSGR